AGPDRTEHGDVAERERHAAHPVVLPQTARRGAPGSADDSGRLLASAIVVRPGEIEQGIEVVIERRRNGDRFSGTGHAGRLAIAPSRFRHRAATDRHGWVKPAPAGTNDASRRPSAGWPGCGRARDERRSGRRLPGGYELVPGAAHRDEVPRRRRVHLEPPPQPRDEV